MKKSVNNYEGRLSGLRIAFSCLLIIFSAILLSNIVRNVFSAGSSVSFSSFLTYLGSVPQIPFNDLSTIYISGSWPILDELRVVLNQLVMPLNIVIFLGSNLWNCILYVVFFLKFLFVG